MNAILIDYDKVIDPKKHHRLIKKLPNPPKLSSSEKSTNYKRGMLLIVPKSQYDKLSSLPLGNKRVNYIDEPEFTQSIKHCYYTLYNKERNLCQLNFDCGGVENLSAILAEMSNDLGNVVVWVCLPMEINKSGDVLSNCLDVLIEKGFDHPYITDESPFKVKIPHSLALVYNHKKRSDNRRILLETLYVLQQYKQKGCSVHCRFDSTAIKFLKKASDMGHTKNGDNTVSQKEISGELKVIDVIEGNDDTIFVIGVDKKSITHGVEEEVTVTSTRYNFHSHPREAYVRHSVEKAWPSLTDYLGYLKLGKNTIFHVVATLEGLYIMSFSSYWVNKLDKLSKGFIEQKYDIDHKERYNPFQYVNHVNNIKYKGHPIYILKFLPWGSASSIFSVSYSKDGLNCIADENASSIHSELNNESGSERESLSEESNSQAVMKQ